MNKLNYMALAALPLLATWGWSQDAKEKDEPAMVIAAEGRCVPTAGIAIPEVPDNQVKYACLRDRNVQNRCNPDGDHARIEAFRQWESQLMEFKDRCAAVGGQFAFSNPQFVEPTNAKFCGQAQPEVQYSEFETPLCNFVSRCPQVAVSCNHPEDAIQGLQRTVFLPGIPKPVSIAY
jgi:hypothetical protein